MILQINDSFLPTSNVILNSKKSIFCQPGKQYLCHQLEIFKRLQLVEWLSSHLILKYISVEESVIVYAFRGVSLIRLSCTTWSPNRMVFHNRTPLLPVVIFKHINFDIKGAHPHEILRKSHSIGRFDILCFKVREFIWPATPSMEWCRCPYTLYQIFSWYRHHGNVCSRNFNKPLCNSLY